MPDTTNMPGITLTRNTAIDKDESLDDMVVAWKKMIDVVVGAVDCKMGVCLGSGRGGQARGQSVREGFLAGDNQGLSLGVFFDLYKNSLSS